MNSLGGKYELKLEVGSSKHAAGAQSLFRWHDPTRRAGGWGGRAPARRPPLRTEWTTRASPRKTAARGAIATA
eukprot:8488808-Alexandrium_andersonii.AAC.1